LDWPEIAREVLKVVSQYVLDVAVLIILLVANGFLSMAEMAVVSSRRPRLQTMAAEGKPGAARALALAEDPGDFLSTVQIGITAIGIFTGVFSGARLAEPVASVLRAIDEDPGFWGLFYLGGLGWAMRNDMTAARADMQLALLRRKSLAQGRKIPHTWWTFCAELLDAEKQAQIKEYFEDAQI